MLNLGGGGVYIYIYTLPPTIIRFLQQSYASSNNHGSVELRLPPRFVSPQEIRGFATSTN